MAAIEPKLHLAHPVPYKEIKVDYSQYHPYLQKCFQAAELPSVGGKPLEWNARVDGKRSALDKVLRQTGFALMDGERHKLGGKSISNDAFAGVQVLPELTTTFGYDNIGVAQIQGKRGFMEDVCWIDTVVLPRFGKVRMTAIADGHGDYGTVGPFIAKEFAELMKTHFEDTKLKDEIAIMRHAALNTIIDIVDEISDPKRRNEGGIRNRNKHVPGTTLLAAIEVENGDTYLSNVGDSRAIWVSCDKQNVVQLTEDQSLRNPRMLKAWHNKHPGKGVLKETKKGIYTITSLGMARDVSNHQTNCRPKTSCKPAGSKGYKIIFSDGAYKVVTNINIEACVREAYAEKLNPQQIAARIAQRCAYHDASDNISVIVIDDNVQANMEELDYPYVMPFEEDSSTEELE